MSTKYCLRWGIIGPGDIARAFGRDLSVNPETRQVDSVEHVVVAAASSSSKAKAQEYLENVDAPRSAAAYGSYADLVRDPNVDIIYIATPHSHHFQQCMLCLSAGKDVLCEKPITVNAVQLETLIRTAGPKGVFLMEAAWTRYMPASRYVQDVIASGAIGPVHRVFADLSTFVPPETVSDGNRLFNPNLAGGVLMDIGIYALTWVFMSLYHRGQSQCNEASEAVTIVNSAVAKHRTGVDAQTSIILQFPRKGEVDAHGIVTTSMLLSTEPGGIPSDWPAVRIQGSKGEIQVLHPAFRPEKTRVILHDGKREEKTWKQPGPGKGSGWKNGFRNDFGGGLHEEGQGHEMFWEADECAFAIRDGRQASSIHPLSERIALLRITDQVRSSHGVQYPAAVELAAFNLGDWSDLNFARIISSSRFYIFAWHPILRSQ